jgi:DNA (cytosine-5)-methyltransferase 1
MKILNLYAGIGGNRKLWGDEHEITAIEYDQATADVYKSYFPDDEVLVKQLCT